MKVYVVSRHIPWSGYCEPLGVFRSEEAIQRWIDKNPIGDYIGERYEWIELELSDEEV